MFRQGKQCGQFYELENKKLFGEYIFKFVGMKINLKIWEQNNFLYEDQEYFRQP